MTVQIEVAEPGCDKNKLTLRQLQVLKMIALSETTLGIALHLNRSPKTVEFHRAEIYRKTGLNDVAALTRYAIKQRVIEA